MTDETPTGDDRQAPPDTTVCEVRLNEDIDGLGGSGDTVVVDEAQARGLAESHKGRIMGRGPASRYETKDAPNTGAAPIRSAPPVPIADGGGDASGDPSDGDADTEPDPGTDDAEEPTE